MLAIKGAFVLFATQHNPGRNAPCQPSYISVSGIVNSPAACLRSSSDVGRSAGMVRRFSPPLSLPESPGSMVGGGAGPECLAHGMPQPVVDARASSSSNLVLRSYQRPLLVCSSKGAFRPTSGVAWEVALTRERSTILPTFNGCEL